MRRLNVKLLLWLMGGVLVSVIGVHVIHGIQIDKNADILLRQAEQDLEKGDSRSAVRRYSQYLKNRDDADVFEKRAKLAVDIAESSDASRGDMFQAFSILEATVRRHDELTEVRRRLAEYMMKVQRFNDAMTHFDILRQPTKFDSDLEMKYAVCLVRTGKDEKAAVLLNALVGYDDKTHAFDKVKAKAPALEDAYVLLSDLVRRRFSDAKRADEIMDQLVAANPDSAAAHLDMGRYCQRYGHLERARDELQLALKLSPNDADIILAGAENAIALKQFDAARELLTHGVKEHSHNEGMYRGLATLALGENKPDEAMTHVDEGLVAAPNSHILLLLRADLQMRKQDLTGLRESMKKMQKANFLPELIGFYDARIALAEGKWLAASKRLERLRPALARFPEMVTQVDLLLGESYQNLGQYDRQLEAFRRALAAEPNSLAAHVGHSRALMGVGKKKEATDEMERVGHSMSDQAGGVPQVRNNLLQLRISQQLQKPAADRNWEGVDEIVAQMREDSKLTEVQKGILDAEISMLKDNFKQARQTLAAMRDQQPQEPAVWMALLNLLQRQNAKEIEQRGKLSEADKKQAVKAANQKLLKLLDVAQKQTGDIIGLRIVRAAALARLGGNNAKKALAKLETGIDKFSDDERLALWAELGSAYLTLRDYENVRRCYRLVAEKRPDEPRIKQTLFDLAQEFGDEDDMHKSLEEIGQLTGTESALYKYCQAMLLVWEVRTKRKDPSILPEARKLVDEAAMRRKQWHVLARLEGEIDDLEGKTDAAIANFQRALELGPANPGATRRLVGLLYSKGRMEEVQSALSYLGTDDPSDVLSKIKAEALDRTGHTEAALDLAEKSVAEDPENATNHLWYGQLLARAGETDKAEAEFRLAVSKAPTQAQGWLVLINHLNQAKKKTEATKAIREAKKALPEEQLPVTLGQAYEIVGDRDMAEKYYLSALEAKPQELGVLRGLATFYLRANEFDKARPMIERILAAKVPSGDKDAATVAWGHRAMAQILSRKGNYTDVQKAIKLIEAGGVEGQQTPEDSFMIVSILASRPDPDSRNEAIKLLERLQKQQPLGPAEQLMLAQLYERAGSWSKARDLMAGLVSRLENNAPVLGQYVQMLLRHEEVEDVGRWMDKLEALQPKAAATIQLKSRWLVKQGKAAQAVKYIQAVVPDPLPDENLPILGAVAGLLEELDQFSAAEKMLREFARRNPRAGLALAAFLGRHGSIDEAFALCEAARKAEPVELVTQVGLQTLRRRPEEVGRSRFAQVEKWIQEGLDDNPGSTTLQMEVAELRDLAGRPSDAVLTYRKILEQADLDQRQRAIVKNNLCYLLATRHASTADVAEAEQLVAESIAYLGPTADLLDTRAVTWIAKGDGKRAIADLKLSIADAPLASKYFHLAQAEDTVDSKMAVVEALKKAHELKINTRDLSPAEQKEFERLEAKYRRK